MMAETYELALRPTTINGRRHKNDYAVVWTSDAWGRRRVGRIRLATEESFQGTVWLYYLQPALPIGEIGTGRADSLKQAQQKFRSAFARYCADAGDLNRAFPAKADGNG